MSPGTGTGSAPNSSPCVGVCLTGPDHDLQTLPKKDNHTLCTTLLQMLLLYKEILDFV